MVTSDFNIKFIEANNYPLWPRGTEFLNGMMQQMGVSWSSTPKCSVVTFVCI